jgi:hypothetical protein
MLTTVKRTQIYLEEHHAQELDRRARARHTTRSKIIREALDDYLGTGPGEEELLQRFREAVDKVYGIAPYLPENYISELREAGAKKLDDLEERWRG